MTTRVALRRLYTQETDIARWLAESASLPPPLPDDWESLIDTASAASGAPPSSSQREAAGMVLRNRVSVLSGGAGVGKSFTIALIYRIFAEQKLSVGLCAPTGKAAKRMSQLAGGARAQTIHRLLGWNPRGGEWEYNSENKLPYDLIVVDESSMCDIGLLWRLLSAVDLRRTCVLFVGDHNQLPPIGAGNFLRDVLAHALAPSHILTECFRAAGELKQNCNAILTGKLAKTTPVLPAGGREWYLVDTLADPDALVATLCGLMTEKFAKWGFDPLSDTIVLTCYNKGKLGVNRLNLELQRAWQAHAHGVFLPTPTPEAYDKRPALLAGDRVIQIKNDYKLGNAGGIMNGTLGLVRTVHEERGEDGKTTFYDIDFEDCEMVSIEAGSDAAGNVKLAYAISTHKSQGSEWPCVVSIIHRAHTYMLNRCLLYTAATRARKTTILLGDKLGMRRALQTVKTGERRTWLALGGVDSE